MQYPIINLITQAYINNGWTGLNISVGKNLFDETFAPVYTRYITSNSRWNYSTDSRTYIFRCNPNTTYTISMNNPDVTVFNTATINVLPTSNNNVACFDTSRPSINPRTITPQHNYILIQCSAAYADTKSCKIQIETGSDSTTYEPYQSSSDFSNRLKLPIIKYFPYPVIDSLQRASINMQTNDDIEILRHYLTPLGIGGF